MDSDFTRKLKLNKDGEVIDCYEICRVLDSRAEKKSVSLENIFDECEICPFKKYLERLARFEMTMEDLMNG